MDVFRCPGTFELAALLPELGAPAREGIVSAALFEQVLGLFERLSDRIPTLLVLKAGRELDRIVGVQPKAAIARRLERVIA